MPLGTVPENPGAGVTRHRQKAGKTGYLKGLSAEDQVIRHYAAFGATLLHQRWRGTSGELDLVLQHGDDIVIVEVKASRNFARAAHRLSGHQIQRIFQTAEEFLTTCPLGQLTSMRFDVALVDGAGRIEIIENALMDV